MTQHTQPLPHQKRELAVKIFIASLGVFFLAALVGYAIIMSKYPARFQETATMPLVPPLLWCGTVLLFIGSFCLEVSLRKVRNQKLRPFQKWITAALVFGALFCVIQTIGLSQMLSWHYEKLARASDAVSENGTYSQTIGPYGLIATLVLLHGAHFLGGLGCLAYVTRKAFQGRYDHEYHSGVTLSRMYWRFMDVIWIAMVAVFLIV